MVGLAFAIAASANFPALVLSIFWRRLTTRGRADEHARRHGVDAGADLPVADDSDRLLKNTPRGFPLRNPGIVSIPLSFAVAMVVRWVARARSRRAIRRSRAADSRDGKGAAVKRRTEPKERLVRVVSGFPPSPRLRRSRHSSGVSRERRRTSRTKNQYRACQNVSWVHGHRPNMYNQGFVRLRSRKLRLRQDGSPVLLGIPDWEVVQR